MNEVILNTDKNRFELKVDNKVAIIEFDKLDPNILDLKHTEVPETLVGKGIGSNLINGALQYIKNNNLKIIPSCSFVQNYISKHPEWIGLIAN